MAICSTCAHWLHTIAYLIFFSLVTLLVIFSCLHFNPKIHFPNLSIPNPPPPSISSNQSSSSFFFNINASQSLRNSGFNFMATLLEITPELFLPNPQSQSQSQSTTIFAIHDFIITNISLPPFLFKSLLHYHTSPLKLTIEDLLKKPQGSCIPTLVDGKKLMITKSSDRESAVEINGVLISHPNLFNDGSCSIHGVLKPFSVLDSEKSHLGLDLFSFPDICEWIHSSNSTEEEEEEEVESRIPWNQILRQLNSSGFTSFAIGLNSVLDHGILQDPTTVLKSVTIFAPPDFDYEMNASSSPLLMERIVRFHILPERFSYKELVSLTMNNASLRTLVTDMDVQITERFVVKKEIISVNGVEITAPDVLSSDKFIVHGISQPLKMR